MQIKFSLTGPERKRLVQAISESVGVPAKYNGPPTFSYTIGEWEVDKQGTVSTNSLSSKTCIQAVIESLSLQGFVHDAAQPETQEQTQGSDRLTIELPATDFTEPVICNLQQILKTRERIIKNALGVTNLAILQTADTIKFPWFDTDTDSDHIKAYAQFITALCQMAKAQKRINASAKDAPNDKYAFRCFLLRLGFIGDEYKETRRTLLKNLTGSAAFRSGVKKSFSAEDLDAATDDPAVVEAVKNLLNKEEATKDEIPE